MLACTDLRAQLGLGELAGGLLAERVGELGRGRLRQAAQRVHVVAERPQRQAEGVPRQVARLQHARRVTRA